MSEKICLEYERVQLEGEIELDESHFGRKVKHILAEQI
jgi:hypothetical protein